MIGRGALAMPLPADAGTAQAFSRPADGTFTVEVGDTVRTLRPWTWGERARIVRSCTNGGHLDRQRFVQTLCRTLYEPAPDGDLERHALIALTLLRVEPGPPLSERERQLAERFGWMPSALDQEPAEALDRLLVQSPQTPPPDDGWTRIRVTDAS